VRRVRGVRTVLCRDLRHGCTQRRGTRLLSAGGEIAESLSGSNCQAALQGRLQISRRLSGGSPLGALQYFGRVSAPVAPGVRALSRYRAFVDRRREESRRGRTGESIHFSRRVGELSAARQAGERGCFEASRVSLEESARAPHLTTRSRRCFRDWTPRTLRTLRTRHPTHPSHLPHLAHPS
jgi:hypothetical protein